MVNVTIDQSALKNLCLIMEELRQQNTNLFKSCEQRALILRGWLALSRKKEIVETYPIMVNAIATPKLSLLENEVSNGMGIAFENSALTVVMFRDKAINRAIEVVFAIFSKYRKTKTPFYIYRQILRFADFQGCPETQLYIRRSAKVFLREPA